MIREDSVLQFNIRAASLYPESIAYWEACKARKGVPWDLCGTLVGVLLLLLFLKIFSFYKDLLKILCY